MDPDWMDHGSCRDHAPEVFFPSDGVGVTKAQRICRSCPVQFECLEFALVERIDHGVWGGASERERRRIIKRRKDLTEPVEGAVDAEVPAAR